MPGFDQRFDRIEAQQSRIDLFMVDYQRNQYSIYDHHYRQGHIALDHVHPSWYTPPPGDFGYIYGSRGALVHLLVLEHRKKEMMMRKIMIREMKRMKREMRVTIRVLAPSLKPFCRIEDTVEFCLVEVLCLWSP